MKSINYSKTGVVLLNLFVLGYSALGAADAASPLDANQHPNSPQYESLFPDQIVPLDTRLSWKSRFLGDESFNAEESLPSTSPYLEGLATRSGKDDGMGAAKFDTTGIVKQVKLSEGKVKIEHGPIERLGMPAMTMMFQVEEPGQLEGIEKGAEVGFNVENTAAGFSITRLEKSLSSFDTTGVVKQVKLSEGKVKIEHGPIERLGMPAMTMMFKVRDMAALDTLNKNMEVEFDVVNSAGGFEITRIKPVSTMSIESSMAGMGNRTCYQIGPFNKKANVDAVNSRYQGNGVTTKLRATTDRQYIGDMVYIDSQETRQAALDIARSLEQKGISDTMILNEPGKRNALSLGIFGQNQNAARLKAQVEAMNIPVKSEARFRQKTVYWLHNEQMGTAGPLELLTAEEIESGIRQSVRACNTGEDA